MATTRTDPDFANEFPRVLGTLLDEVLQQIPAADEARIRLLECPLPDMESRLVPGLGKYRRSSASPISPIFDVEPEVTVRKVGDCIVGYAAQTRKTQFVADLGLPFESQPENSKAAKKKFDEFNAEVKRKAEDKSIFNRKIWDKYLKDNLSPIATEIAVPLFAGNNLLGAINAYAHRANVFKTNDTTKLELIAEKAVIAILQAKAQLVPKVGTMAEKLAGHFDLNELGNALAEEVKAFIPGSLVDLYSCSYDAKTRNWKFQRIAFTGATQDERNLWKFGPRHKGGMGLRAIRTKTFVFEEHVDDKTNKRASTSAQRAKIKSTGCLPLIFGEDVVGVLYIHSKTRHYFALHEKEALDVFGRLAAVAIHNVKHVGKQLPAYEDLYGDQLEKIFNATAMNKPSRGELDTLIASMNGIINERFFGSVKKVRGLSDMNACVTDAVTALASLLKMPDDFIAKFISLSGDETYLQKLPNYRDHYLHSFHVFLLGYMRHLMWWNQGVFDLVPKNKRIIRRWFAAAIFHDAAYSVESTEEALEDFFKNTLSEGVSCQINLSSLISSPNTKLIEHYEALRSEYSKDRQEQADFVRWLYKHLIKTKSHGILAAIILLNLNWDEADRKTFVPEAALDIVLHNYHDSPEEGRKMSFHNYPLAGLLTYCDEIQERDYYSNILAGKSGIVKVREMIFQKNCMICKLLYDGGRTHLSEVSADLNRKAENVKKGWKETSKTNKQTFYVQGEVETAEDTSLTDQYLLIG